MTDQQTPKHTIVLSLSDSVPEVLAVLRRAANSSVTLDIPAISPLFLTANEFRALQAIAQHDGVDLTITSDDPLRQQLAMLFKLKVATPEPVVEAQTESTEAPIFGPEQPPEPEPDPSETENEAGETDALAVDPESTLPTESSSEPIVVVSRFDPIVTRARSTSRRQWLIGAAALVVVLAVAYLGAYQFLSKATVTLTLKRQPIDQTLEVAVVAPGSPTPSTGISIVAEPVTFAVSTTRSAPATGKKTIGDAAARGTISLSNPTGQPVTIAAGTTIDDQINGTTYQFVAEVQINPGAGGAPGFGQAEIVCTDPGTVGNRDTGLLSGKLDNGLYYSNRDAAIGGGTDRQSTFVTEADLQSLQTAAMNDLVALASTQSPGAGLVVLIPSITIQQPVITPDAQVGQEVATITAKASGQASALAYNAQTLNNAARNALASTLPEGYQLDPSATQLSSPTTAADSSDGSTVSIRATGSAIPTLTEDRKQAFADGVAGKSAEDAMTFLTSQPEVESAKIGYSPGWLPKHIPSSASGVEIKTQ